MAGRLFGERLPDGRDVLIEVVLLDDGVRPELLDQLVFGDETSRPLEHHPQRVEHLAGQRDRPSFAQQLPFADVHPELAEFVDRGFVGRHARTRAFRTISDTFQTPPKDPARPRGAQWTHGRIASSA